MSQIDIINVKRFIKRYPHIISSQHHDQIEANLKIALELIASAPEKQRAALKEEVLSVCSPAVKPEEPKRPSITEGEELEINSTVQLQRKQLLRLKSKVQTSLVTPKESEPVTLKRRVSHSQRDELLGVQHDNSRAKDEDDTKHLANNQAVQDELSLKLIESAAKLRDASLSFSASLKKDKDVLANTSSLLDENQTKLNRERERIKAVSGGTWNTTFMVWISLLAVVVVFLSMYIFIRTFGAKRGIASWYSFADEVGDVEVQQAIIEDAIIHEHEHHHHEEGEWDDDW
jgi:Membrane fusion protein Use1